MSDIIEGQLWHVTVKDTNRSIGYSVVVKKGALLAQVEDIAFDISAEQGPDREITGATRTCTVYLRRVTYE